jgi:hypothetical protein
MPLRKNLFLDKGIILNDNDLLEFFDSFDYFVNGKETRDKILEAVPELKPLIENNKKPVANRLAIDPDASVSIDSDGVTIKIPKPSISV